MNVSVVIPTYNCSAYLAEAIESVLEQTRLPDEIIVVDDGSTDDTVACLEAFGDRITVFRQEHLGAAAARNHGIEEASGDWVAFLDADDLWVAEKLEKQIAALEASREAALSFTNRATFDAEMKPLSGHRRNVVGGEVTRALFEHTFITGVVVRRDLLRKLGGFDESLPVCEDYDLWLRASLETPFVLVDDPLYKRRLLPDSLSHDDSPNHLDAKCRVLDDFASDPRARERIPMAAIRRRLARVHFVTARAHRGAGNLSEMDAHLDEVIARQPFHFRARLMRWVAA